jgi:uncharacterized protein YcbK (DUF882 family)
MKYSASSLVFLALGTGIGMLGFTRSRRGIDGASPSASAPRAVVNTTPAVTPTEGRIPRATAFTRLPSLCIANVNTRASVDSHLYDADGKVDEGAGKELDLLLVDARDPAHVVSARLDRRTLQLLFRAAYHFHATRVDVVSAYRQPSRRSEGLHATGRAVDFKLPGVSALGRAAYLRSLPRVGVYTNPKTQYVHLDVRDHSYYWLDASPPGRTWRERSLGGTAIVAKDEAYTRSDDWPEGAAPPS